MLLSAATDDDQFADMSGELDYSKEGIFLLCVSKPLSLSLFHHSDPDSEEENDEISQLLKARIAHFETQLRFFFISLVFFFFFQRHPRKDNAHAHHLHILYSIRQIEHVLAAKTEEAELMFKASTNTQPE